MVGRLRDLTMGMDGSQIISIAIKGDFREEYEELKDSDISIDIKKYRKQRSLDANGMAWSLINKIAKKLQEKEPRGGWTPLEVYRGAIRDIAGACTIHCMRTEDAQQFIEDWTSLGMGFQVETFPSKVDGCINGKFWKGSHLFDTQQMSTLINILIQEAEQQGVPTLTDEEVAEMMKDWRKR